MRSAFDGRPSAIVTLALSGAIALAADGCSRVSVDFGNGGGGGAGGSAGGGGGSGGTGGDGGDGGGTGGGAGSVIGGSGGAGGGASGRGGAGGSAATGGTGGVAGTGGGAGTGGSGGTTGSAGTGGASGRGGTGGGSGTTGTGGMAGTGGGGRGGTGGGAVAVMPSAPGQIVISELMHNTSTVADDFGEWFEVYNPSTTVTYDLMGCQVLDSSTTGPAIATPLVLAPMTFKTLAVSATPGGPTGTAFTPDYVYGLDVKFDNMAGERAAISCNSVMIDDFVYPSIVAGGGGRAFNLDPRHYNAADNNDMMMFWCLARNTMSGDAYETTGPNYGTPGRANTECPQVTQ